MAKPYRRRKGKSGPYVGNYRVTIDGRDINLQTKDAHEATARARLAKLGKWPPIPAAVDAALDALDPGRDKTPDPPPDAEPADGGGGASPTEPPVPNAPPPRETPSHEQQEPLNEAMHAAAAEASGHGGPDPEVQAEQENGVNTELAAIMAELGGGQGGADLLDGLADGAAAFILWAEAKALELGVNWALARRKSDHRLKTKPVEQGALMRKALRVGLKGMAVIHFPEFSTRLTPGWAIAIGMIGGAGQALMTGELVTKDGKVIPVSVAVAQSQEPPVETAPPQSTPPAS